MELGNKVKDMWQEILIVKKWGNLFENLLGIPFNFYVSLIINLILLIMSCRTFLHNFLIVGILVVEV